MHGVEVELGDLGEVVGEPRRAGAGRRPAPPRRQAARPRKPATSRPALPVGDELLGVDVRQRREPELRLADQLGEDAARAERDERAEDRVLDDAGEQLGAAARSYGCTSTGPPIRSAAARTASSSARSRATPPRLGLVRARGGGLHDRREAELAGRGDRLLGGRRATRSGTSGMP